MMTRTRLHYLLLAGIAFAVSFLVAGDAMAQTADASGDFTGLLDLIQNSASNWSDRLQGYAETVFWSLALIQLVWTFFPLVFKQADLGEIFGELIRFVVVIGFFYALLTNCTVWAGNIVDSFRKAGSAAAGLSSSGLKPGDMFDVAIDMATTIGTVETWNPLTAMMVSLSGLVVLLCFAFIAAFMGLTIIESYIVINASVLFMGFGGSSWTRDYAVAMLRYAVAVGAKLFVLTLLVGLIVTSAQKWQAAYNSTDDASLWTMVGLALTCAYFAKTLPELVASLITGVSPGGGNTVGMMAAAGMAGAAAATSVATGGAAAPVAAGGLAAAGGGTAAAGSGLAGSISASMAGGAGATGAGAGAAGLGATGAAAGTTGGSGLGTAATTAARVGGNGLGAATGGGDKAGSSLGKLATKAAQGSTQAGASDGQAQQAAPASTTAAGQQAAQATGGEANAGRGLHTAASAVTRGTGIISAISVPGMEGSAGLSLGSPPPGPSGSAEGSEDGDFASDDTNTIRPSDSPVAPAAPAGETAGEAGGGRPVTDVTGDAAAETHDRAGPHEISGLNVPGMTPRGAA